MAHRPTTDPPAPRVAPERGAAASVVHPPEGMHPCLAVRLPYLCAVDGSQAGAIGGKVGKPLAAGVLIPHVSKSLLVDGHQFEGATAAGKAIPRFPVTPLAALLGLGTCTGQGHQVGPRDEPLQIWHLHVPG